MLFFQGKIGFGEAKPEAVTVDRYSVIDAICQAKREDMDGALPPMSAYTLPCTLYSVEMKDGDEGKDGEVLKMQLLTALDSSTAH